MKKETIFLTSILCAILMLCNASGAAEKEEPQKIEPRADELLRQSVDYLANLKHFRITGENMVEIMLDSGQKIQVGHSGVVSVRRPNKFWFNRKGDVVDQEIFYDGKTVTLYGKKVNFYATAKAPPTVEAALDYLLEELGMLAPGADLLQKDAYDKLMKDVSSGFYVGVSFVDGVRCHHLAFRGKEVDWQIWIQAGNKHFPRKYVITSKWITGWPQYTLRISDWDVSSDLPDDLFTFKPPKNAEKIDFIPATEPETSQQ